MTIQCMNIRRNRKNPYKKLPWRFVCMRFACILHAFLDLYKDTSTRKAVVHTKLSRIEAETTGNLLSVSIHSSENCRKLIIFNFLYNVFVNHRNAQNESWLTENHIHCILKSRQYTWISVQP